MFPEYVVLDLYPGHVLFQAHDLLLEILHLPAHGGHQVVLDQVHGLLDAVVDGALAGTGGTEKKNKQIK